MISTCVDGYAKYSDLVIGHRTHLSKYHPIFHKYMQLVQDNTQLKACWTDMVLPSCNGCGSPRYLREKDWEDYSSRLAQVKN
jgi:hypothetical protein